MFSKTKNYTEGVDFEFLKAMGIEFTFYQPWQIGLFHEELEGKFVWYPRKGTLMYSDKENGISTKIKTTGDFKGSEDKTEEVYNVIMEKLSDQQTSI